MVAVAVVGGGSGGGGMVGEGRGRGSRPWRDTSERLEAVMSQGKPGPGHRTS